MAQRSIQARSQGHISDITDGKLDVLIHIAADVVMKGFDDYNGMKELDAEFITTYKTNALGPIHAITVFPPLLRAPFIMKIIVISAGAAECKFNLALEQAKMAAYGMSKAAALIATTKFAVKLKYGFVAILLNPGLVDVSGMNRSDGSRDWDVTTASRWSAKYGTAIELVSPESSVSAQLKVIDGLRPSNNGLHLTRDGEEWALPA